MSFKSIDDFRSSELFKHITETEKKVITRVLHSTRLEDLIYTDLREQVCIGLDEIEAAGKEKLSTFASLICDAFQAFYGLKLRYNDVEILSAVARWFNIEILNYVINSDKFQNLKSLCEGQEVPAYEATVEFSRYMLDRIDDFLNTESGSNAAKALDSLEQQQEQLLTKISEMLENDDPVTEGNVLNTAADLASKEQQIERLSEIVSQNIHKNKDVIQAAVAGAADKAQEASDAIKAWGNDDSSPATLQQNADLLHRVQSSPELRAIIKHLGRYREILDSTRKNSYSYGRGEKYDIVLGGDFTRALSSEYAYLALPETVPLFIRKAQQMKLRQYRKRQRITKGHGDIVVCIDESGSMAGENIAWAKAVALVLLEYTKQNKRSCAIVRFASKSSVKTHVFKIGEYTVDDVFTFAESFLNGGTDFEAPLTKAIKLIEHEGFENADITFITDGACSISEKFASNFRDKSTQLKFKVTGIVIDTDNSDMTFSLEPFCENVYRLSELTGDEIAVDLIKRKYQ